MTGVATDGLIGRALAGALLLVLAGCATTAPAPSAKDWPMVPAVPSTTPAPKAAIDQAATEAAAVDAASEALVSLPVPPETSPLADLPNVFDRIRLGYALPDVSEAAIDRSVKFFVGKPDFLDRTFERGERYL